MATHTHLPDPPQLIEYVTRRPDGSYDLSAANAALLDWRDRYNKVVREHNKNLRRPLWFRIITGYRNPEPIRELGL